MERGGLHAGELRPDLLPAGKSPGRLPNGLLHPRRRLARRRGKSDAKRQARGLLDEQGQNPRHRRRFPCSRPARDHAETLQNRQGRCDPLPVGPPGAIGKEAAKPLLQKRCVDLRGRRLRTFEQESGEALLGCPSDGTDTAASRRERAAASPPGRRRRGLTSGPTPTAKARGCGRVPGLRGWIRLPALPGPGRCSLPRRRGSPGRRQAPRRCCATRTAGRPGARTPCRDRRGTLRRAACRFSYRACAIISPGSLPRAPPRGPR